MQCGIKFSQHFCTSWWEVILILYFPYQSCLISIIAIIMKYLKKWFSKRGGGRGIQEESQLREGATPRGCLQKNF